MFDSLAARLANDEGFLLVEVLVSVLLVALIVVATLNGFDAATRVSADQRHHSEATLLAAQSQEQLRSDPASALDGLESSPHTFTKTIDGTTYTVLQEAKPINSAGQAATCKFSETTAQNGAYIQVSSNVTWPQLNLTKRPAVKQASLIAPPTGSDLEVDVSNGAAVPAGVSGVTATASFIPVEAETPATIEGTTGTAGCVVLTGIPSTNATVAIAEKGGFVTPNGTLKVPTKELAIAPNITTHYPVTYNEAGKISVEYTYKGENPYLGTIPVYSDTFVAYNVKIPAEPKFEVGSPAFEYKEVSGEEQYKARTTTLSKEAATPAGTRYAAGDLFPFSEKWQVYAGDCPANSILSATESTEKLTNPVGVVEAGKTTVVKVPLSYVELKAWTGTAAKPESAESQLDAVKITNTECASARTPNNAFGTTLTHEQKLNGTGHLSYPFQPFGKAEICVFSASTKRTYTTSYTNSTVAGSSLALYLGELPKAERETAETNERSAWKTKQLKNEITLTERTNKEANQTTERNTIVANESTRTVATGRSSC
jgi:Tfp pilus assembly protein PilV